MKPIVLNGKTLSADADVENFVSAFNSRQLPKHEWTHQAHLVVGLWYTVRYDAVEALNRIRSSIRQYNEAIGTENTDRSGYHETLTRFYLWNIASHVQRHEGRTLIGMLAALLDSPIAEPRYPFSYYSRERLFSVEARRSWVEPDLRPSYYGDKTP